MGLIDKVKISIAEALAPARANENKELAYLREIYTSQGGVQRNSWYRILGPSGDHVGFEFVCACGTSYQLLHITDWMGRQHQCGTCKTPFDLLKACGITSETPAAQWTQHFAKLPARPRLSGGKRSPGAIDTWDTTAGDIEWGGSKPNVPEGWV